MADDLDITREEILLNYLDALPFEPYPVQERALMAYFDADGAGPPQDGGGVLVCAPTGTGKTLIAEAALYEALQTGTEAYYTTPLIALTEQKYAEICEAAERWGFSAEQVGLVTGNRAINPKAPVKVVVAEILLNRLLHPSAFDFSETAAVVMDEFHSFAEPTRGIVWELTLSLLPTHVRLMLLSATVGNAMEFLSWLQRQHKRNLKLVQSNDRRVPLSYHWIGDELLPDQMVKMAAVENEMARRTPALIFCFDRERCWATADVLRGRELISSAQQKELQARLDDLDFSGGAGPKLKRMLTRGIGVHHAGLLPKHRRLVETLFQEKLLSVCVCTETLAAGMNLPARSVVLTTLVKGPKGKKKLVAASQAQQMFGRAGRPQYDTEGHVYAVAHEDDVKILRHQQKIEQIPEDTKDPKLLAMRKKLIKKAPKRRDGVQYWSETQFEKLQTAQPGKLESRGQPPWRLLAFLLSPPPLEQEELEDQQKGVSIADLRDFVGKRLMSDAELARGQVLLTEMLVTLHEEGYVKLSPEPPTDKAVTEEENAESESAVAEPEADENPLAALTLGGAIDSKPKVQEEKPQSGKSKGKATPKDPLLEYEPQAVTALDSIRTLQKFRAVDPMYGAFLLPYLGQADRTERIQILESLLEMPGSVARSLRIPFPADLPPGEMALEMVDPPLLQAGLVTQEELYPPLPHEQERPFGEPPMFAVPLAEKMLMLFRLRVRHSGRIPITPVWAVGDMLQYGDDFYGFIASRELAKQEGVVFRHALRMILLCDEFLPLRPPGVTADGWEDELRGISNQLTAMCRTVDPDSTDETLSQGA